MSSGSARQLAIGALVVGLLVGFMPTSAGGISCGSAFVGSRADRVADFTDALEADARGETLADVGSHAAACEDRRSLLRIPAVALIVLGGGALLVRFWRSTTPDEADYARS